MSGYLSFRVFRLLPLSLYSQRFGRHLLRPPSGVSCHLKAFGINDSKWQSSSLQVQSWLQASNNTGILNNCARLSRTESEQATPVDLIKHVVQSSVFDKKHLMKARKHIGWNTMNVNIKMKTIIKKPWMIKLIKFLLRNSDNWCVGNIYLWTVAWVHHIYFFLFHLKKSS